MLSLEAWIKRQQTSGDSYMGIISKGNAAYSLRVNPTGNIEFLAAGVAGLASSSVALADTAVHHVVATKNGATIRIYVDGVDVTVPIGNTTLVNNAQQFQLAGAEVCNLTLDEAAIYPTALTLAKVQNHYALGASGSSLLFAATDQTPALAALRG